MSKKNFVSLILGTIGGVLFSLGMCMTLLPQWNALVPGVILGGVGLAVLLVMAALRRKMEGKPLFVPLKGKTISAILLGIVGALTLGVGMCLVLVWEQLIWGIAVGLAGILLLLGLIPLTVGIRKD